jgi:hypothetical protein
VGNDFNPLAALLSKVLRDLTKSSFARKYEPNMHGLIELVMRNIHTTGGRPFEPVVLLPANDPRVHRNRVHVCQLKTLTLLGMWQATNFNDDAPTVDALRTLHEELVGLDEEDLLARPCRHWSQDLQVVETRLVGSFLDPDPELPQFLAVGGARVAIRRRPRHGPYDYTDIH